MYFFRIRVNTHTVYNVYTLSYNVTPELTFDLTALRVWINWYCAYRPVVGSEPSIPPPMPHELDMIMHGYNPGTWEVETRPEPQSPLQLHPGFQAV